MRIIISPAKKMNVDTDTFAVEGMPVFLEQTNQLMRWIRELSEQDQREVWKCNDKLTALNRQRFADMELTHCLTPALISYEGLQYQHIAPVVMEERQLAYLREHLRILSGFYGVLKPFDGVVPYRLEMQARHKKLQFPGGCKDLYTYWGSLLYREITAGDSVILNLASKEYAKAVLPFLSETDRCVTCVFGERNAEGKVVEKGTMAKMARGEMVNYLSEVGAEDLEAVKGFDRLGYRFQESLSDANRYVFLLQEQP